MNDDDRQLLQRFVDALFSGGTPVSRLDAVTRAEALDLPLELLEIVGLLPPGRYTRNRLCDQLNSALKGHGWTRRFGTVD
jgi:hypothetical protein